jgi:hypothetical protein
VDAYWAKIKESGQDHAGEADSSDDSEEVSKKYTLKILHLFFTHAVMF